MIHHVIDTQANAMHAWTVTGSMNVTAFVDIVQTIDVCRTMEHASRIVYLVTMVACALTNVCIQRAKRAIERPDFATRAFLDIGVTIADSFAARLA